MVVRWRVDLWLNSDGRVGVNHRRRMGMCVVVPVQKGRNLISVHCFYSECHTYAVSRAGSSGLYWQFLNCCAAKAHCGRNHRGLQATDRTGPHLRSIKVIGSHVEFTAPSVARKTDTQNAFASRVYLCDSRDVVTHAGHL
jgi:hypothetical protein